MTKKYSIILTLIVLVIVISGCIEKENIINNPYKDSSQPKKLKDIIDEHEKDELKFAIIGDPHTVSYNISNRGNERLGLIMDFVNKQDIDFVVIMGDVTDDGTDESNDLAKKILKESTKSYYTVAGNHDILLSPKMFERYYGPMEHIEVVKGFQLIFVGIYDTRDKNGNVTKLGWKFDFEKANKNMPTLIFMHGTVLDPPSECDYCNWGPKNGDGFFKYAASMKPELDKFTNLLGVYSGHVHYNSDQTLNNTIYVTINGLIDKPITGYFAYASNDIGYTIIKDEKLSYKLISYK